MKINSPCKAHKAHFFHTFVSKNRNKTTHNNRKIMNNYISQILLDLTKQVQEKKCECLIFHYCWAFSKPNPLNCILVALKTTTKNNKTGKTIRECLYNPCLFYGMHSVEYKKIKRYLYRCIFQMFLYELYCLLLS